MLKAIRKLDERLKWIIVFVWFFFTVIGDAAIASTFIFDDSYVLERTPKCLIKEHFGVECISCGMTRAFLKISKAKFMQAWQFNKLSIPVYGAIVMSNFGCLVAFYMLRTRKI
ncbi:MAG: hypothetical protein JWO06_3727 [Bacteroidota bacterium]|nr:hypothetical protein [Bacteroidota bacterium]